MVVVTLLLNLDMNCWNITHNIYHLLRRNMVCIQQETKQKTKRITNSRCPAMFILEHKNQKYDYLYPSRILQWCDNSFHLEVVVKTIDSFLPANTTHLVPTKRNCSIKNIKAINPHSSSSQCPHQSVGRVHVLGKHACR